MTSTPVRFDGRRYRNAEPDTPASLRLWLALLRGLASRQRAGKPSGAVALDYPEFHAQTTDLTATWLGHATVLVEVDGYRVLTDPMFGRRASPVGFVGPRRLHPAPLGSTALPHIDAVVISHDHYDHLDKATIAELSASSAAPFLVPLNVGAHLESWGVPRSRIVELGWGEDYRIGALEIACTPARHFSGRGLRRNRTLWSSWALAGPEHRVFFGGDTGYMSAFADIGRSQGPFDLTVLPIGAYADAWPDVHMDPEQAVRAHRELGGGVLLPIHWATFDLALHSWAEPVERLLAAADSITLALARPGRRFSVSDLPAADYWWR